MSDTVVVTFDNTKRVAQRIVELLVGRTFKVVSFVRGIETEHKIPGILFGMKIRNGFMFDKGCISIKLNPSRKLFWDLNKEKVTVSFSDDDDIIIERLLPDQKTLYRVVVITA